MKFATTFGGIQKEIKNTRTAFEQILNDDRIAIFVDGKLFDGETEIDGSTLKINVPKYVYVNVVELKYGMMIEAPYIKGNHYKINDDIWGAYENKEHLIRNQLVEGCAGEVAFINGNIYEGPIVFGRVKGVGWLCGRTCSIELHKDVPKTAQVWLMDLKWGRLRKCEANVHSRKNDWKVIDDPETTLEASEELRLNFHLDRG